VTFNPRCRSIDELIDLTYDRLRTNTSHSLDIRHTFALAAKHISRVEGLFRYSESMNTEPVETYRGILIYQARLPDGRNQFRCTVNGEQVQAQTLPAVMEEIDREYGPSPAPL
jgi:hypothetical protein